MMDAKPNALPALIEILEMAPGRWPDVPATAWDDLLATAIGHQVLPSLYRCLEPHVARIPAAAASRLKDNVLSNAARSLARADETAQLVKRLAAAGIPTLCFRGPVLSELLYADPTRRQFADLDFLVRRSDAARAMHALRETGLQPMFNLGPIQEQALIRFQTERFFLRAEDRLCIDLHWQILPEPFQFEPDEDALWSRGRRRPFQGVEVGVLSDEDLLLFLCAHGAKHGWSRLNLLCDVRAWLLEHPAPDWNAILARADRAGKRRLVLTALRLANRVLDAPLPVQVPDDVEPAAAAAMEYLFRNRPNQEEKRKQRAVQALCLTRFRDRHRLSWDPVFSVTGLDIEKASLPRSFFLLYRLIRLARLVGKYSSRSVE